MLIHIINLKNNLVFMLFFIVFSYTTFAKENIVTPTNSDAAELLEGLDFEEENEIGQQVLVDSKEMALELAEFYIKKFYGERTANHEKPYRIIDNKTEWIVSGRKLPLGYVGGVFLIVISKADGRVIILMHPR